MSGLIHSRARACLCLGRVLAALTIFSAHVLGPVSSAQESPASGTRLYTPYVDMSLTSAENLVAIARQTGIKAVTLAFIQSTGNGCEAGWGGLGQWLSNDRLANGTTIQSIVKDLQKSGVQAILSFGGQVGAEPALKCKDESALKTLYQSAIDRYGVKMLDFDIESGAEKDQASIELRDRVLAALKKADPGLSISFTLEVMPTGLTASGVKMLASAKRDGLDVDLVNVMAMDYGAGEDNNGQMGLDAIQAAKAAEKQIQAAGLHAKVGITAMIGENDEKPEVFTLTDAQRVLDFAKSGAGSFVSRLSIWSLERDNGGCAGKKSAQPNCSGIRQSVYEFSEKLKVF